MLVQPSRSFFPFFVTGALLLAFAAADRDLAKSGAQSEASQAATARAKSLAKAAQVATMYDARVVTGIESAEDRQAFASMLLELDEGLNQEDSSTVDKAVATSKTLAAKLAEDVRWLFSSSPSETNKETEKEVDTEAVKEHAGAEKGGSTEAKDPEASEPQDEAVLRKLSFEKTSSVAKDFQSIVSKLGDHMSKELPEKTDSSLEASEAYKNSLGELDNGLQSLEVGVKTFKKGVAKIHGDHSKTIRASLENGMKAANTLVEQGNPISEHVENKEDEAA